MIKRLLALPLVLLMACGNTDSPDLSSTVNGESITEAEAKKIYTMKCALCHGTDGKLMIAQAPDLSKSRLSLNDRIALITYGKSTMPPQKDVLSTAEIRAVALYIESFTD